MRTLALLLTLLFLCATAITLAQGNPQSQAKPTATPAAPTPLPALPLKPDHYTQLQLHDLNIARIEQALEAARTARANAVLQMFVEVGGSISYDPALNVIDPNPQRRVLGFLLKAEAEKK